MLDLLDYLHMNLFQLNLLIYSDFEYQKDGQIISGLWWLGDPAV